MRRAPPQRRDVPLTSAFVEYQQVSVCRDRRRRYERARGARSAGPLHGLMQQGVLAPAAGVGKIGSSFLMKFALPSTLVVWKAISTAAGRRAARELPPVFRLRPNATHPQARSGDAARADHHRRGSYFVHVLVGYLIRLMKSWTKTRRVQRSSSFVGVVVLLATQLRRQLFFYIRYMGLYSVSVAIALLRLRLRPGPHLQQPRHRSPHPQLQEVGRSHPPVRRHQHHLQVQHHLHLHPHIHPPRRPRCNRRRILSRHPRSRARPAPCTTTAKLTP
mmetsp:Transcript_9470/g.23249  ORF Transcript_9470/g.23249 Transcript_9470/m.23249 type:complete len:275 (+) Transcript_9470:523-1347(+)